MHRSKGVQVGRHPQDIPTETPHTLGFRLSGSLFLAALVTSATLVGCKEQPLTTAGLESGVPAETVVLSGDRIAGVVGAVTEGIAVQFLDEAGDPLAGVPVWFKAAPGGGELTPVVAQSDEQGIVRTDWTLGQLAGEQEVEMLQSATGESLGRLVADARPGPAVEISVFPEAVTLPAGVPFVLDAQVRDEYGNKVASLPMEWTSENERVAHVGADGRVVGLAVGLTEVGASLHPSVASSHPDIYQSFAPSGDEALAHHRAGHAGGHSQVEVVEGDDEVYVSATSGDGQVGIVDQQLSDPLRVQVVDAEGRPMRNVVVEWAVEAGNGSLSATKTETDGRGRASVRWTLGSSTGTQRTTARVGSLGSVTFSATALGASGTDSTGSDDDSGSGDSGSGSDAGDDEAGTPERVTDLRVYSTSTDAATLRFTQVDDGSGSAANYHVRFAVHPIGWGWGDATKATEGSCAGEIQGTSIGSTLTCTVQGLESGIEYDFQLVAFRGSIEDGTRVYGSLSNVATGRTEGTSSGDDSSDGNDSGGDDGSNGDDSSGGSTGATGVSYPNEPSGHTLIAWSQMSELFPWGAQEINGSHGAWWQWQEGDPDSSIGNGSNVPGGPYYNRTRYRAGLKPGTAPVNWGAWDPNSFQSGQEQERIYFSQHIRLVDSGRGDWESQGVGTKLGFWGAGRCSGALNDVYTFLEGGTRSEFQVRMMQQNVQARSMGQNRKSGAVMRVGEWHHWEVQMILNDIGHSNGVLRWWIDGELVMEYTDVVYRTSSDSCGFRAYKWNPTWGGTGGPDRSRDDFIDISDLRISGRALR